ncbi:MAG TPA: Ig-like domain-containing protein [Longimicrobiaceae bacterium]|nr:Ig-like domain-containing protein [Longimicrobiaceae bacterium]
MHRARGALLSAALLALASCSLFTDSDDRRAPAQVATVGGNGQRGIVGEPLGDSVVVEVTDRRGRPIPGVEVDFALAPGAGTISPARATTGSDGRARAHWTLGTRAGALEGTATSAGKTATFQATAEPAGVATLEVTPDTATLRPGETRQLSLRAVDAHGNAAKGPFVWKSSDPEVLTVSDSGLVRAVAGGEASVTVSAGPVADTARLRIRSPVAISITSPPADTTLTTPLERFHLFVGGTVTAEGALARVTYTLGSGEEQVAHTFRNADGTVRFDTRIHEVSPGTHVFTIRAEDAVGNRTVARRTIRVESPARTYTLAYLGTLGGADSKGLDLNARGDVVGSAQTASGETRAFLWRNGTLTDLGAGLAGPSRATAISNDGTVVGTYESGCTRSFVWKDGARTAIAGCSSAVDVNDAGTIVFSESRILRGGTLIDLQASTGTAMYGSFRVNAQDVVLGEIHGICGGGFCTFGPMLIAPPYGGADVTAHRSGGWAVDLNDRGDVAAVCSGGSGQSGRCAGQLFLSGGQTIRLLLGGMGALVERGSVTAINNQRQVVGVTGPAPDGRPFLWEGGRAYRIEVRGGGWVLDGAVEINDAGQVLAHGRNTATGQTGAVLLTPDF